MAPRRQVIYDSEDSDADDASPRRPVLPPPAPNPLAEAATSTSTDPSFFRDIYAEQQNQGLSVHVEAPTTFISASPVDPWGVPSSPEAATRPQRTVTSKRKRLGDEGYLPPTLSSSVIDLDVVHVENDSSARPSKRARAPPISPSTSGWMDNQRQPDDNDGARYEDEIELVVPPLQPLRLSMQSMPSGSDSALEIVLPQLAPMTPSKVHAYQMASSSCNSTNIASGPMGTVLPPIHHSNSNLPGSVAVTESTVAYTTPSQFASSGRHSGEGDSAHHTKQPALAVSESRNALTMSSTSSGAREPDTATVATPPRLSRKAAMAAQLLSSPDIIAEPALLPPPPLPPPLSSTRRRRRALEDEIDTWEEDAKPEHVAAKRWPRPMLGADDELSGKAETVEAVAKSASRPPTTAEAKKAIYVAVSSDHEDNDDLITAQDNRTSGAAPPRAARQKKAAKPHKSMTNREPEAAPAKRPPGRQKRIGSAKAEIKDTEQPEQPLPTKHDSGTTAPVYADGNGDASKALQATSGNASVTTTNSFAEDSSAVKQEPIKDNEENSYATTNHCGNDSENQTASIAKGCRPMPVQINLGSSSNQGGRVPFRVGLSKKLRVAPLLKSMRK